MIQAIDQYKIDSAHPIIFSTEMIRSILEGRKTQTRRIIKPQPELTVMDPNGYKALQSVEFLTGPQEQLGWSWKGTRFFPWPACLAKMSPYGMARHQYAYTQASIGDLLWVRETWGEVEGKIYYKADRPLDGWPKMKSPLFMPKSYSRLWLEITDVRVERLQDISHQDAKAEGVWPMPHRDEKSGIEDSFIDAYRVLWNSINGEKGYPWQINPWVWVIEFRVIDI